METKANIRAYILELHFNKNLQYKNTTIIIAYSYFIAILIPFLTGQLSLTDYFALLLIFTISSAFITLIIILLNEFNYHLKRIPEEIKKLQSELL